MSPVTLVALFCALVVGSYALPNEFAAENLYATYKLSDPSNGHMALDKAFISWKASDLKCYAQNGVNQMIIRLNGCRCKGAPDKYEFYVDTTIADNILAFVGSGMQWISFYYVPCPKDYTNKTITQQLTEVHTALAKAVSGHLSGIPGIFMDIEEFEGAKCSGTLPLYKNASMNIAMLKEAIKAWNDLINASWDHSMGAVYSKKSSWANLMNSTTEFSSSAIWYAHYDGKATDDDWVDFGGWTKDVVWGKQYSKNVDWFKCGQTVDQNAIFAF